MIKKGKKLFPDLTLAHNDEKKIPFQNNTFDAVILLAVLTCITNNYDQEYVMSEIDRILKPKGIIYINDFLLNSDERNIKRYDSYKEEYSEYGTFQLKEGAILRHHSLQRIEKLVNPFHKLIMKKVVYTTMNGNTSNGFYYLGKKAKKNYGKITT